MKVKHTLGVLGLILTCGSRAESMTVLPMNLVQMAQHSGKIIHGKVISVREETHKTLGISISVINLQTEECLKGDVAGQVEFRQVNGMGLPMYRQGEEIVIFLYPESRAGLTSPVGADQGLFKVIADQEGKRIRNLYPHLFGNEALKSTAPGKPQKTLQLDVLKARIRAAAASQNRTLR